MVDRVVRAVIDDVLATGRRPMEAAGVVLRRHARWLTGREERLLICEAIGRRAADELHRMRHGVSRAADSEEASAAVRVAVAPDSPAPMPSVLVSVVYENEAGVVTPLVKFGADDFRYLQRRAALAKAGWQQVEEFAEEAVLVLEANGAKTVEALPESARVLLEARAEQVWHPTRRPVGEVTARTT